MRGLSCVLVDLIGEYYKTPSKIDNSMRRNTNVDAPILNLAWSELVNEIDPEGPGESNLTDEEIRYYLLITKGKVGM